MNPGFQDHYYSPQPSERHPQPQARSYEASDRFRPPSTARPESDYCGNFLPTTASFMPAPQSASSRSYAGPTYSQGYEPPHNVDTRRVVPNANVGVSGHNPTAANVFRFGEPGGPFRPQQKLPTIAASLSPAVASSQRLDPLGYPQHNATQSPNFNSRHPPIFGLSQPTIFKQTSRPPFLQTPVSKAAQPFLHTPKTQPTRPAPTPVTWDNPIVNHNVDAQSLRNTTLPPLRSVFNGPPTPSDRPFQPPSMSAQDSAESRSFRDMHREVHPNKDSAITSLHQPTPLQGYPSTPIFPPRPSSSTAKVVNASSSRDEESSDDDNSGNPAAQDAENNWALADQPDSVAASAPTLGEGERQLKSRTTDRTIADACADLLNKHDQEWLDLAKKNGWPMDRVRRAREIRIRTNNMKDPTPYQAGLFHVTKKLNSDLPKGRKLKLIDLHQRLKANDKVMKEIKIGHGSSKVKKWTKQLKEHRATKIVGTRGSSKGIRKAGTNGYKALKHSADTLSATTGALTFGFVCRSEFGTPVSGGIYGSGNMEDFLQETYKTSAFDFLLAAESYSCLAHLRNKTMDGVDRLKVSIVGMILKGLRISTGQLKLQMEYKHYRVRLVKKWHVRLTGWPSHIPFVNAHDMRDEEVREIYELLRSGSVRWEVMNNKQYGQEMDKLDKDIENGTLEPPTRAERSDKGKKHNTSKSKQAANESGSVPTPSTSSGSKPKKSKKTAKSTSQGKRARPEHSDGRGSSKAAKTSSNTEAGFKSREILTDSDDSDDNDDNDNEDNDGDKRDGGAGEEEKDPLDMIADMGMSDDEDELGGDDDGDDDSDGRD
ncbi:hypothetical protein PM082_019907 [Marasmius tenuissimus]|nr:hypothetical protein PM082_019907 [Marasmius tenuissimus]